MKRERPKLSERELHEVLVRSFERIKPLECAKCAVPRPHVVPRFDADGPNWSLRWPARCEVGCAGFMRWLWRQYGSLYDLVPEAVSEACDRALPARVSDCRRSEATGLRE